MSQLAESASPVDAVAALVIATAPGAGSWTRAALWRPIAGRTLATWPLQALAALANLRCCALITPLKRYTDGIKAMQSAASTGVNMVIPTGGHTWRRALASVADLPLACEWVIALDAAEPLVTTECLRAGLHAARRTGVAIAGAAVNETMKRTQGRVVIETPPRARLMRLVSPVVFQRAALERALAAQVPEGEADGEDLVALAQRAGAPLTTFAASYPSVRLTSEADLALIEQLLIRRQVEDGPA